VCTQQALPSCRATRLCAGPQRRTKLDAALYGAFWPHSGSPSGTPSCRLCHASGARASVRPLQIDLVQGMVDCLYAECTPCITACVMAELEKLGQKYRVALKIAKDPRIKRLSCSHNGTYADDCLCERVTQHRCYIVATCDKDLRRRLRKARFRLHRMVSCGTSCPALGLVRMFCSSATRVCSCCAAARNLSSRRLTQTVTCAQIPGVPVMYLHSHRYTIERLPEATLGGAPRN
jgi:rRNA-processing protein FCF1